MTGRVDHFLVRNTMGSDAGRVIAQRLRGEPILAVGAVEIAAKHTEGQRVGARQHVEEGLFLHRV